MDIVEVLPWALGNKKFLLVTTDYFTKWVKAKPLGQIREVDVIRSIRKNILSRFGIHPQNIFIRQWNTIHRSESQGHVEQATDRILQLNTELPAV